MLFLIDSENPVNSKDESTLTDSAVTKAAPESPRGGVCLGSLGAFCALLVRSPPPGPSWILGGLVPALFKGPSVSLPGLPAPEVA